MKFRTTLLASALAFVTTAAFAASLGDQTVTPNKLFQRGSRNVAVIEPAVAHPDEKPCTVPLYSNAQFGADNVNFSYTPPKKCPGPYAAIVLSVDVSLDKGVQYDRSGTIWIGGAPMWFGTTAEPNPGLAPAWHFERDVTDYTSLLNAPQSGFVLIANYTNQQDTSIITTSANLLFYPVPQGGTAPKVPDMIVPLAAPGGGTVTLNTGSDVLAINQTLPTNIAAADLDVYLQGQSNDEFWYTCVPDDLATELQTCGGGALREGEITVDGAPAGVAPAYPWIFTGGINPRLWAPIPGVQTLNFTPFRVPLTPFAGVLSNGAIAHQIGLSVSGADSYFSVAGALKLYLDHNGSQTTGSITKNTLTAEPSPTVTNTITTQGSVTSGDVDTTSPRNFVISGTVVTSAGTQTYTVRQTGNFTSNQQFNISNSDYVQNIQQLTDTTVKTVLEAPSGNVSNVTKYSFPLNVGYDQRAGTTIAQAYHQDVTTSANGSTAKSSLDNSIDTKAVQGSIASEARYATQDNAGNCFERRLRSVSGALTGAKTRTTCSK